jgi:hypothetical protein
MRTDLMTGTALPANNTSPMPVIIDAPANPAPVALIEPFAVRLADASNLSGLSRSVLYREAARGKLTFLKYGERILVDYQSLKSLMERLPRATIRVAVMVVILLIRM